MKNKIHFFLAGALLFTLITGCKSKSTSELNANVAAFVSNSDKVVAYGYLDFTSIEKKAGLTQIPELGSFVQEQLASIRGGLRLSDKIHFALEGPLDREGIPSSSYIFMSIENKDSLQLMFEEMGFFFEKEKDLMVFYDMNMAIAFNESTVVWINQDFSENEPIDLLENTFAILKSESKEERVTKVLAQESDLLIASHLENLYKTSNTSLKNLSKEQQEEIDDIVEDGHLFFTLDFNDGNLTAKLNASNVSDDFKAVQIFKEKGAHEVIKNIGPGAPLFAMTLALDVERLEDYLTEQFLSDTDKSLFSLFGTQGQLIESMVGDELSDITDGNIGMMFKNGENTNGMGGIPMVNIYLGLGNETDNLMDLLQTYTEEGTVKDLGDGYYQFIQGIALIKDNSVVMQSGAESKASFKVAPLTEISEMKDFGDQPFSLYIDLKNIIGSDVDITRGNNFMQLLFQLSDHFSIDGNNEEIVAKLVLKDKNTNILKQLVKSFEEELKDQVGNISF